MSEFWVMRKENSLIPATDESVAEMSKVPFGKYLRCEVKQPRNPRHHRLYWTLCTRIASGVGCEAEEVSDLLKIATGHCTTVRSKTLGVVKLPKSIAFHKMDQTDFAAFFERCVRVIYEEWQIPPDAVSDLLVPQADHDENPRAA